MDIDDPEFLEVMKEAVEGVITCRECGNSLEPDIEKCYECGWKNPVRESGMI